MNEPIFDKATLHKISTARLNANSDLTFEPTGDEQLIQVTRDRSDIGIPAGTQLLARPASEVGEHKLAIVYLPNEHVLRRPPVTEGVVVGVVVAIVEPVS